VLSGPFTQQIHDAQRWRSWVAKLAGFDEFTARIRLGITPAAPHTAIDNRLTSPATLQDQIGALLAAP
jgi:hypothetical protein